MRQLSHEFFDGLIMLLSLDFFYSKRILWQWTDRGSAVDLVVVSGGVGI